MQSEVRERREEEEKGEREGEERKDGRMIDKKTYDRRKDLQNHRSSALSPPYQLLPSLIFPVKRRPLNQPQSLHNLRRWWQGEGWSKMPLIAQPQLVLCLTSLSLSLRSHRTIPFSILSP